MRFTQLEIFDFTCMCEHDLTPKMAKPRHAGHMAWLLTNHVEKSNTLAMPDYQAKQYQNEPPVSEELKGLRGIDGARKRAEAARKRTAAPFKVLEETAEKPPQFFVADIAPEALKSDLPSLEFPLFALRQGDKKVVTFKHNNIEITITPPATGRATISDRDLWIYCISNLVAGADLGKELSDRVRFTAYDFLAKTQRDRSGRAYERLRGMLERLSGTRVVTNIETGGRRETQGFGLIDYWRINEDENGKLLNIEVQLPKWLMRSIETRKLLTISSDYFALSSFERRIYELARKHCGRASMFKISIEVLHKKSGSAANQREFLRMLKQIEDAQSLPDYRLRVEAENIIFAQKSILK